MITTLLALAAAAATGLAQRLRVPAVPVLILAGAVLAAMPGVPTLDVGDPVNLETDVLAKYVQRQLQASANHHEGG